MRPAALLREAAADMAAAAGLAPQLAAPGAAADPLAQYGIIPTSQPALATPRMGNAVPAAARTATAAAAALAPAGSPTSAIQQSIARIHEACQAPPMSPHEYRTLFEVMAKEISENDLIGAQTLANITQRAQEKGLEVKKDDVRFVLEVVSEADPWFEQGASANLFAGRFRNFVVARCRGQGLNLSADELDLIDAWFAGGSSTQAPAQGQTQAPAQRSSIVSPAGNSPATAPARIGDIPPLPKSAPEPAPSGSRWWTRDDGRAKDNERVASDKGDKEDFPRFVRNRLRG
jgi:hypothetical protein